MKHTQLPQKMLEKTKLVPKDLLVYATIKRHQNHKTGEAFPSLDTICKESGISKPTVRKCINNLQEANYISVRKEKRRNIYSFNPYKYFEPFSEEFLDSDKIGANVKAYILAFQEYLFKDNEGVGITSYSDKEIAEKLNMDVRTITKYNNELKDAGFLDIIETTDKNKETGLTVQEKIFHLTKLEQGIIWVLKNHEEQIQENSRTIETIIEDKKKLEKTVAVMMDIMRQNGLNVDLEKLDNYPDSIIL